MAAAVPGVRLLPNAVTVLALCAGLSAVQFALRGQFEASVFAIGAAALFDGLDGRIARLLDASSKIGAELDSLADSISFGVSPALVMFIWGLDDLRAGWIVALVFAVCTVLRLARFNTLLDDEEQPPYAKEFFVGVPSPTGAMLALLPLVVTLQWGDGWWSSPWTVAVWTIGAALLMVSRLHTFSFKTVRVPTRAIVPMLVLVVIVAAGIINYPFVALSLALIAYLLHVPYAAYRYRWLLDHPEVWNVAPRQRRQIRRSARRLGLRRPLRRRVAGAASRATQRVRRRRNGNGDVGSGGAAAGSPAADGVGVRPERRQRRLGLRRGPR